MAIDEALFLCYKENISTPVLRIYGWKPPAISVGRSQNPCELIDIDACRREGIDIVRRPTGGGIIFHDQELTYSLVLSQSDIGLKYGVKESFEAITSFLISAYRAMGAEAAFAKNTRRAWPISSSIAAFCFSRSEEYDIVIAEKKIGGNAQKRRRNIILQHGSIPLSFDKDKVRSLLRHKEMADGSNITSIHEISLEKINFEKLSDILINSFSSHFKTILKTSELSREEKSAAEELKTRKYSNINYNSHADCQTARMA